MIYQIFCLWHIVSVADQCHHFPLYDTKIQNKLYISVLRLTSKYKIQNFMLLAVQLPYVLYQPSPLPHECQLLRHINAQQLQPYDLMFDRWTKLHRPIQFNVHELRGRLKCVVVVLISKLCSSINYSEALLSQITHVANHQQHKSGHPLF